MELFLEEIPKGFNVCPVFHKEKHTLLLKVVPPDLL